MIVIEAVCCAHATGCAATQLLDRVRPEACLSLQVLSEFSAVALGLPLVGGGTRKRLDRDPYGGRPNKRGRGWRSLPTSVPVAFGRERGGGLWKCLTTESRGLVGIADGVSPVPGGFGRSALQVAGKVSAKFIGK